MDYDERKTAVTLVGLFIITMITIATLFFFGDKLHNNRNIKCLQLGGTYQKVADTWVCQN